MSEGGRLAQARAQAWVSCLLFGWMSVTVPAMCTPAGLSATDLIWATQAALDHGQSANSWSCIPHTALRMQTRVVNDLVYTGDFNKGL